MAAWQDTLVLSMAIHHLQGASDSVRRSFVERYERLLFPYPGTSTAQTKWRSFQGITRVTLWGRDHFRNNIRLAMVLEAMNLGPRYYCVMRTLNPGFSERVFLLAQFIPSAKIYLYPHFGLPLRGPFHFSLHTRGISAAISQRIIPMDERPHMCPACDSCFCDHVMDGLIEL